MATLRHSLRHSHPGQLRVVIPTLNNSALFTVFNKVRATHERVCSPEDVFLLRVVRGGSDGGQLYANGRRGRLLLPEVLLVLEEAHQLTA